MSCLGWLAHDPLETLTQLAAFMLPHARIAVCPGHHSLLLGFETRKLFKFRNREGNMHTDATRCGSQSHHVSSDIGTHLCMPRCGQQMVSRMPRRRHIVRPGYALSADKFGIAIEGTCAKCGCAIVHYAYQAPSELGGQADRLRRRCGARRPPRGQIVPMRGRPGRAGGRRAELPPISAVLGRSSRRPGPSWHAATRRATPAPRSMRRRWKHGIRALRNREPHRAPHAHGLRMLRSRRRRPRLGVADRNYNRI